MIHTEIFIFLLSNIFNNKFDNYSGAELEVVLWGDIVDLADHQCILSMNYKHVILVITSTYIKQFAGIKHWCIRDTLLNYLSMIWYNFIICIYTSWYVHSIYRKGFFVFNMCNQNICQSWHPCGSYLGTIVRLQRKSINFIFHLLLLRCTW